MVKFAPALPALGLFALTSASDITVQSSGGNVTGKFGIPYGYGFLHEDINNSGDGGIYAELIQNRAFQYSKKYPVSTAHYFGLNGAQLSIQELDTPLSKALPASLRVTPASNGSGKAGFKNEGYWGIDVRPQTYTGSFWVKGDYSGTFTALLQSNLTDEVFATTEIESKSVADEWTEHTFQLEPQKVAPSSNNSFAITFDGNSAELDFNLISLFPPTYKNRKNGLRVDLATALAEMNPTFLRFPGGNMLEGNDNKTYWDWKDTLGTLKERPGFPGVWGYQQTHGLGLVEYLEWAQDMNMNIVLGVWAGLALNGDVTPEADLQFYIDDALDEIEFVTGPATSKWGARRAELGHPEPFELNYVEVGNEDWLAGYPGGWNSYVQYRLPLFAKAIKAKYPNMQVISSGASSDPGKSGTAIGFSSLPDVIGDYHPYRRPNELVEEFNRFDNDVGHIVGEVAATHVNGGLEPRWEGPLYKYPWWIGAVGEAISLIGYERNSDRLPATFYAPVMKNENRFQWPVTLLQYTADTAKTTRAVTWYCWPLFAHHPITHTLPAPSKDSYGPLYWGAGKDENRGGALVWKGAVYNTTDNASVPATVDFEGLRPGAKAQLTVLTNRIGDPYGYNDPFTGVNIVNSETTELVANPQGAFTFSLPQLSVAVLDTEDAALGPEPPSNGGPVPYPPPSPSPPPGDPMKPGQFHS